MENETSSEIIKVFIAILLITLLVGVTFLFTASLKNNIVNEVTLSGIHEYINLTDARLPNDNINESYQFFLQNNLKSSESFVMYRNNGSTVPSDNYNLYILSNGSYFNLVNNSYMIDWVQNG